MATPEQDPRAAEAAAPEAPPAAPPSEPPAAPLNGAEASAPKDAEA